MPTVKPITNRNRAFIRGIRKQKPKQTIRVRIRITKIKKHERN
ncbi:hypothetical protein LEP1GSC052_2553 [Leptospira kmetyi serovar Malaysia str. Bejo-Iso9]|nr:hypothetical protein LEP1GSC052_2553 [Leptospira kmetyi serovar Malaysia str. Bejo-Iso9]